MKRFLLSLCLMVQVLSVLFVSGLSLDAQRTAKPKPGKQTEKPAKKPDTQSVTVYVTRTGQKYHRDGCRYLRRSRIPMSLKDAASGGYTACSVCAPPIK